MTDPTCKDVAVQRLNGSKIEKLIAELCPDLPAGRQGGGVIPIRYRVKRACGMSMFYFAMTDLGIKGLQPIYEHVI